MSSDGKEKTLPFYQDTGYGFNICGSFDMEAFKSALQYEPRPDDLFIVTYPKCGTTWVQNIVACIYRKGKPFSSALEFLSSTPFLEMAGAEAAKTMKRPGAIKLHLPFRLTPWSPKAKYIFVARNPKDCCVSFYHHTRNIIGYNFKNGNFDDYFELFMDGKVDFGDYFDTLLSWYEHRNDPNVLFLTYEGMKKDTRANVLKIAEFMGEKYKNMLIQDEKILDDVIKNSSFDFMKQNMNRQVAELATLPKEYVLNHPDVPQGIKNLLTAGDGFFDPDPNSVTFVRKGIVGDYKNYFSPEQNRRLEEKFIERTKGTEIPELWKDIMNVPPRPRTLTQYVDGFPLPALLSLDCYRSTLKYKPRPDDLFVATYPKCGTTWVQHILLLLFRDGEPVTSQIQFFSASPYIEFAGAAVLEQMARPLPIKTHLPYHLAPRSEQAKYIYITRNPKDCCVSFFYHVRDVPIHGYAGTFDDFFELFITGNLDYGDYFDHLLGWYAHRNDPNVLFLTYEQLKENPTEMILKIASFIDDKTYAEPLRNNPDKLKKILDYSSFKHMRETVNKGVDELFQMTGEDLVKAELPDTIKEFFGKLAALMTSGPDAPQAIPQMPPKKSEFIRKGIIGDWKNHFTQEQSKRMDQKFAEKTKGTDLPDLWKKYM